MLNEGVLTGIESENINTNKIQVNLRIIQRNARQSTTIVEGLDTIDSNPEFLERLTKHFKKTFNCSAVVKRPENTIKCTGDQREKIKKFLVSEGLVDTEAIRIFGH